jgi:large subunit ribosomal protein L21e
MLKKNYPERGKIPLSRYFQEFNYGDKVALSAHSSVQKGMYFRRFHGMHGDVVGKRGECYRVLVQDGRKLKMLNVHPIHLKRVEQ